MDNTQAVSKRLEKVDIPTVDNRPEARFMRRAQRITAERGGMPVTTFAGGRYVFTYPDGTVTTN